MCRMSIVVVDYLSMDNPSDKRLIVDIVKSWILKRSEPTNLSRDFWMPDHSCRVCYECDTQFTVFNRRHHCRLCGRVFCAKCTTNTLPIHTPSPKTSLERIRVCNYCFKQCEEEITAAKNATKTLSPSLSSTSLASTKSSGSSTTPYSTGQAEYGSAPTFGQFSRLQPDTDKQDTGDPFEYRINRSDDDDDESVYQSDSQTRHFPQPKDFYGSIAFDEIDHAYESQKVHLNEENLNAEDMGSSHINESTALQGLDVDNKHGEELERHDNGEDSETVSSLYGSADAEPVDFENNGLLWFPPEPEDEEDEREAALSDDDDDANGNGEWGYLRSSNTFVSGEYRSRDKSNEEQNKVMKTVVDGHFRALVSQLLQVENLPVGEEDKKVSWLEIITSLSWEAATLLKPDTSKGGGMDPGGYVKVKCLACGRRSESMVIRGVVCKKNVAHRRMTSKIEKSRFLILGGALEYQRVSNLLSSFDTLLQQEMDHLKMAVAKIDAHHPDVLLVEKSVSRFAQDYLLAKDISLVLNIKRPLLERIARCTGAQIVPSIDHLSSQKLGLCESFHVEKYLEGHGSAGQGGKKLVKTLMFFEGCPKPFGCTILLKGANGDELKKVKKVLQYGVFAAYHLALETSFLADEGASLPELPLKSPITVALPDKQSSIDRSISTIPGFTVPVTVKSQGPQPNSEPRNQNEILTPVSNFSSPDYNPCVGKAGTSLSPASSEGPTGPTSTLINSSASFPCLTPLEKIASGPSPCFPLVDKNKGFFETDTHAHHNVMAKNQSSTSELASFEEDSKTYSEEPGLTKEEFPPSPSDHQSILVSLSTRCVWKGTVCERAHLFRIKYYGSFDKPLGRFLRDHLFDQSSRCHSCEMPSEAHVHCYTHQQGSLTISVKKFPEFILPGEREGKIWMWHRCLRCPRSNGFPPATRRVVMSDAAWGLSLGKFLELSFSNHAAASRVASCGHSLHRDCLRFYGFGRMVACFRYASIDVHSVYLPPLKLDFSHTNQEWIQNETNEMVNMTDILFTEVFNALRQIAEKTSGTGDESRCLIAELKLTLQKEKEDFEESLNRVIHSEAKRGHPVIDILEINRLRRQLLSHSYIWDHRLICAANLHRNNPEKGLSSSISLCQEKPLSSIEKIVEKEPISKKNRGIGSFDSIDVGSKSNITFNDAGDPQNQPGFLHQGVYMDHSSNQGNDFQTHLTSSSMNLADHLDPLESGIVVRRALSEGQFPILTNLSDSLDAAWTGENHPCVEDSSIIAEDGRERLDLEEHLEDQGIAERTQSLGRAFRVKNLDNVEDSTGWGGLPFMNFYRSFNKISSTDSPKLDTVGDYSPVYVLSFRQLKRQCGARLLLPVGVNDTVVPVYDDEPTSIISYTLISPDYHVQMLDEWERAKDGGGSSSVSLSLYDSVNLNLLRSFDETPYDSLRSLGSTDDSYLSSMSGSRSSMALDPLLYSKSLHVQVSFTDDGPLGKVKYTVTCYYAKRFEALRRMCCPSEIDFVRSLSRCKKWGAQGGKSNVFFAKSLDDRFIIKQVTKTELESFIKFAPEYFKYLSESIGTRSPTCLAKILGIYQVTTKHLKGGKETRMDVLVMENLLFGKNLVRLYDLKGSSRSRYNPDSSGSNKVLLDQNLIEAMPTSPIFVGNKAKRLLERAVWNDTSFLASIDVMDYSLLVGVDEEKHELVLGIIDFMRQYTWDKHLETWVKASGILGGPKNSSPTIISPMQYKKRFRKAMSAYFLVVPDQWSPPTIIPSWSQSDLCEESMQGGLSKITE